MLHVEQIGGDTVPAVVVVLGGDAATRLIDAETIRDLGVGVALNRHLEGIAVPIPDGGAGLDRENSAVPLLDGAGRADGDDGEGFITQLCHCRFAFYLLSCRWLLCVLPVLGAAVHLIFSREQVNRFFVHLIVHISYTNQTYLVKRFLKYVANMPDIC